MFGPSIFVTLCLVVVKVFSHITHFAPIYTCETQKLNQYPKWKLTLNTLKMGGNCKEWRVFKGDKYFPCGEKT